MLKNRPISIVTSYTKQRVPLPFDSDIVRLQALSSSLYSPSRPVKTKPPRRGGVETLVRAATRTRHVISDKQGYVRLRVDLSNINSVPSITLNGSATRI